MLWVADYCCCTACEQQWNMTERGWKAVGVFQGPTQKKKPYYGKAKAKKKGNFRK